MLISVNLLGTMARHLMDPRIIDLVREMVWEL
jgi:hypothetical protein